MWAVCKATGRAWPKLSDDDVIDFMIMEAVALKSDKADQEQAKKKEVTDWKRDKSGLDKLRGA